MTTDWKSQIRTIENVIAHYGYDVWLYTDAVDQVDLCEKVVHINSRNHPETRFYTLLHELGHVEIYENKAEEFAAAHPVYIRVHDGRTYSSRAGKVSLIAEEIAAWKLGREFAQIYDLYVDNQKYNKHMTDALMGYINMVAE